MGSLGQRFGESFGAFRDVFRNPNLRRVELAWAESEMGDWAAAIALAVFAYDAGGPSAVGLVYLIRMLPSAFAAPFTAILADRYSRRLVMVTADATRAVCMALAAFAAFADAPAGVIFALIGVVALVATAFHPAQAAILPSLARTPDELTAANVASSTIEGVTSFAGPALAGIVVAFTDIGVSFAITAGTFLWSAILISRIRVEGPQEAAPEPEGIARSLLAGFVAIGKKGPMRVLVGLYAAQTLVSGALNVLVVVVALQFLRIGDKGLGYLLSALGVGGVVGAVAALALIGRKRLAPSFGVGIVLWGAPIALMAVWTSQTSAIVLLAVVGLANTVVDVAGLTLLQRAVPDEVLARVFGILESLVLGTIAVGSILAPVLVHGLGVRWALIVTGAFLPVLAALTWGRVLSIDAAAKFAERELELLRGISFFGPLPGPALEHLASSLVSHRFSAGEVVFRQGDPGDRFYVVGEGEVDVTQDGRLLTTLGRGEYFGEIALLRNVPRTAGITARTDIEVLSLERDEFIGAVTGHTPSAEAANVVVGSRLRRSGLTSL